MKYLLLLSILIVITSCKKEAEGHTTEVPTDTTGAEAVALKNKPSEFENLVADFAKLREKTVAKLHFLNSEEANLLYGKYEKENNEIIRRLNSIEEKLLENYYMVFYDRHGNPAKLHDTLQFKKDLLRQAGLEFWHVGEGFGEIRPQHDFYLKIFKDNVTNDYKRFLALQSLDDSELWSADAGIAITWRELSQRVINWENFTLEYPHSKLYQTASFNYHMYRLSYLFGQDNTPTYEHNDNKLYPEIAEEYSRFIRKHPDSPTAKIAQQMLNNSGNIGFESIREQENSEFQKAYNTFYREE